MALYAPCVAALALLAVWFSLLLLGYSAMFFALGEVSPSEASSRWRAPSMLTLGFSHPPTAAGVFSGGHGRRGRPRAPRAVHHLPPEPVRGVPATRARCGQARGQGSASRRPACTDRARLDGRAPGEPPLPVGRVGGLVHRRGREPQLVPGARSSSDPPTRISPGSRPPEPSLTGRPCSPRRWTPPPARTRVHDPVGVPLPAALAEFFNIPVDHDPQPGDPISITREEFDAAADRLQASGVPVRPDRDQCWRDFAGWRVNYDRALVQLAKPRWRPLAPWSSDRYDDVHFVPSALPWLRRSRIGG